MSIFGWSLPAGVSTLPGEEDPPFRPRCSRCGCFLKAEPDESKSWECRQHCDGRVYEMLGGDSLCGRRRPHLAHIFVLDAGVAHYRRCARCGTINREDG